MREFATAAAVAGALLAAPAPAARPRRRASAGPAGSFTSARPCSTPRRPRRRPPFPSLDFAATQAGLPDAARHALPRLVASERALLQSRDARPGSGLRAKRPAVRVGVVRALPVEAGFHGLGADSGARPLGGGWLERATSGRWTWTASFASDGAQALRLHIRNALLPAGSRVFLYGPDGESFGPYVFDAGTRPEGFWTHTVFASQALLRVELGDADAAGLAMARLAVDAIVHLEHPWVASVRAGRPAGALTPQSDTCFVDVSCVDPSEFPNVDQASHAVGQLNFVDTDGAFICSGGLLNTTTSSMVPYLLTANHCFSTQSAATSLEIFWDYKTPSCGAAEPRPSGFPEHPGLDPARHVGDQRLHARPALRGSAGRKRVPGVDDGRLRPRRRHPDPTA